MTQRYHVNPHTGNPGVCSAKIQCRFGDLKEDHYATADEARAAYEAKNEAFENTPLYLRESAGLYLYEMDEHSRETAVTHLFGMAETLERFYPDDARWQALKEKIGYEPSPLGALAGFESNVAYNEDDNSKDAVWPDYEYAMDVENGEVSKKQLLDAAEILNDKIEHEFLNAEIVGDAERVSGYIESLTERDDYLGFGYLGTRGQHSLEDRQKIDSIVYEDALQQGMSQEEFFKWSNSVWGRWLNDSLTGVKLDGETVAKALSQSGPHSPLRER